MVATILVHPIMCGHHHSFHYLYHKSSRPSTETEIQGTGTYHLQGKVKALININHELRTPLTLIYTPLKQLTNSKQIPYELRGKLYGAFKQARQMKTSLT